MTTSYTTEEMILGTVGPDDKWVGLAETPLVKSMIGDFNTLSIDALYFDLGSMSMKWTGATGTLDGVVKLQASLDNVNFCNVGGQSFNVDAAAGFEIARMGISGIPERFYRIAFVANNVTGGSMTFRYLLKSRI